MFHSAEHKLVCEEGRQQGGVTRSARATTLPPDTPPLKLETAGDVLAALAECYNLTRTGRLGVREANAMSLIAGTILRAVEARTLESEVAVLRVRVEEMGAARGRVRGCA